MILIGSQRGGASNLARHLLNAVENEHVTVQELRGFVANDLHGALAEAHAISKATQCNQFMFSLSLNPPKGQEASLDAMLKAADRAETALGLQGQPRAVVVHEKKGRRHIHVVWSRIDADSMKAVNLPFFKQRLASLSKELYLEHGWELPEGHRQNGWKNPLNFTLAEWQQAQRLDLDPREIKQIFQTAWRQSDSMPAFRAALEEHGYWLARGDRRGFVAMDVNGEVFSAARWTGVKTKELNQRLGDPDRLPSVDDVRERIHLLLSKNIRGYMRDMRQRQDEERKPLAEAHRTAVIAQREERRLLEHRLEQRRVKEIKQRSERLHKGIRGVWELLTGKARAIRRENERDAYHCYLRDKLHREALFQEQDRECEALRTQVSALRAEHRAERSRFVESIARLLKKERQNERLRREGPRLSPEIGR